MSSESSGIVHVLDMEFSGERLETKVHETASSGESLAIDWTATRKRRGFERVAGGVFYVRETDGVETVTKRGRPEFLGDADAGALYRWANARRAPLAAVILPAGHVLTSGEAPVPVAAKVVEDRLAVFWTPGGKAISWLMKKGAPGQQAPQINRESPTGGTIPDLPGLSILEPASPLLDRRLIAAVGSVAAVLIAALLLYPYNPGPEKSDDPRGVAPVQDEGTLTTWYEKSYALVIGINKYPPEDWPNLSYAHKDAEGMAEFLEHRGFEVTTFYDEEATKGAIIRAMQNQLAPKLGENDRVLVFFAGHGYTEELNNQDWGYIVPYIPIEGSVDSSRYISMEELRALSDKMGKAKHQLFIMDACYSGLLGTRSGGVDENRPNYIAEILKRPARQILTAGGKDQQVVDGGPGGHSVFTGYLLEGLENGMADLNGDGYISFVELVSYIQPRATNPYQTPGHSTLPGHGLGEFVFRIEKVQAATQESPEG